MVTLILVHEPSEIVINVISVNNVRQYHLSISMEGTETRCVQFTFGFTNHPTVPYLVTEPIQWNEFAAQVEFFTGKVPEPLRDESAAVRHVTFGITGFHCHSIFIKLIFIIRLDEFGARPLKFRLHHHNLDVAQVSST